MATDFTPASNTPEAAVTRGEGYYRFRQSITNVALVDIYFDNTENIVAVSIGPSSVIPAAAIEFRSKATNAVTTIYVSSTTPWFGLLPSQPAASSPSSVAIRVTPLPNRLWGGLTLELLLWFKQPPFLASKRSPFTSTADGYAIHLDAGVSSDSYSPNPVYGSRKVSFYVANTAATAVTIAVKMARTVYYGFSGTTVPLAQTATTIYSYTTNGTAMDFCQGTLDVDPFSVISISLSKSAGVASDCLCSVFFYDD